MKLQAGLGTAEHRKLVFSADGFTYEAPGDKQSHTRKPGDGLRITITHSHIQVALPTGNSVGFDSDDIDPGDLHRLVTGVIADGWAVVSV